MEKNIGDKVWWATCENKTVEIDCPVCFGKKEVTLILGNGEQVKTDCDYCGRGFEPAKGYTQEYQMVSGVKEIEITGKEIKENAEGRHVEYRYQNYCLDNFNIFETKEMAENRVKELIKEYDADELSRIAYKKKSNQTLFLYFYVHPLRNVKLAEYISWPAKFSIINK
jgi:hypothetical protein